MPQVAGVQNGTVRLRRQGLLDKPLEADLGGNTRLRLPPISEKVTRYPHERIPQHDHPQPANTTAAAGWTQRQRNAHVAPLLSVHGRQCDVGGLVPGCSVTAEPHCFLLVPFSSKAVCCGRVVLRRPRVRERCSDRTPGRHKAGEQTLDHGRPQARSPGASFQRRLQSHGCARGAEQLPQVRALRSQELHAGGVVGRAHEDPATRHGVLAPLVARAASSKPREADRRPHPLLLPALAV
mmetsp:Transcript_60854/g.196899  ORF Transcript_60854/g.196899 Transcript_60854/m.196899 type:complete len:238 (-) Transcript_60854:271-984(-)